MSVPSGRLRAARRLFLSTLLLFLASPTRSSDPPAGPLPAPAPPAGPEGALNDHGSPQDPAGPLTDSGPSQGREEPLHDLGPLRSPSVEHQERTKRSGDLDWNKTKSGSAGRVRTGDTVLNIRGAVRDRIGDAPPPAPGRPRAVPAGSSSRLDHVVIRPAAASLRPPLRAPPPPPPAPPPPAPRAELLVEAHAPARIPCPLVNVSQLAWYKDSEEMQLPDYERAEGPWRERGGGEGAGRGEALVLPRATRADAGEWRCAGGGSASPPVKLVIYEPVRAVFLAVDGRRLDAGNTWLPARDLAPLGVRCHAEGGAPPPALLWALDAAGGGVDTRPYLHAQPANHSIAGAAWSSAELISARELHNASLRCTARQRRPAAAAAPPELSAQLQLKVTYPPSFVISRWPGFGVSLRAGGAAALRCDVDANPPARAWWAREGGPGEGPAEPAAPAPPGAPATLRWPALAADHAGWYRCRALWMHQDYSSIGYFLNVHAVEAEQPAAPEAAETKANEASGPGEGVGPEVEHQRVEVALGGNVQLNCPEGSIGCWWRKSENASAGWTPAGSRHAHGALGISAALYQEAGEYRCVGLPARAAHALRELKRVTLRVGGGASAAALGAAREGQGWRLVCGVCGRGARAAWLRGGAGGGPGQPAALRPDLQPHCWRAELFVHDAAEVWCVASAPGGGAVAVFPARAPQPARHVEPTRSAGGPPARPGALAARLGPLLALALAAGAPRG